MGRIHLLSEQVANKIAAGEVVERPASVVKELLENSLDAGSTRIRIQIEAGGKKLIQITDDGCGMVRDDALLAFERHATSKIKNTEDLLSVATLGFRGEALPSIASVARLHLETRAQEEAAGTVIEINGGKMIRVEEGVVKSWDAAREVHSEYKRILKELKANRVQSGMINKVSDKIVEPLDGAINQEFVRTDESLREFHKTLDGKKADQPAADKARAELTQLIDRLESVLSAMADVMTINDLIKRLIAIEKAEVDEMQRLKILLQKKEDELLNNVLEPNKE